MRDLISTIIYPEKEDNFDFEAYNEKDNQARYLFLRFREGQLQEDDCRHEEWSLSDENRLMELHNKKGNRWV